MPHVRVLKVLLALAITSWTFFSAELHAMTITGTPTTKATVGTTYTFKAGISGANNGVATFYINGRPSWATFNGATGTLTGKPTAAGTWNGIKITAYDGTHGAALAAFTITATGSGYSDGYADNVSLVLK